ncbi:MAG: DUF507 family protein [Polyangiaceae bacterium]|nr:DUF507 family protein [Polyangiaceae bacterium]
MRLASSRVPEIVHEMVAALVAGGDIETESPKEVERDLESVLNQYIEDEREITDRARDMIAAKGLPQSDIGKMRRSLADQRKLKLDDEAIDYLLDQLLEMLMHSNNVEEIFAEDFQLRKKMREPLRRQADLDGELQEAVRNQLKHVKEGTSTWEIEYRRVMEDIKRRKGL